MRRNRTLGDILYESATIAFDTSTGIFFNPVTKTNYGATPPPGGWPISWYKASADGSVQVPVGPGAVAQTAADAAALKATVTSQLANQSGSGYTAAASAAPTTPAAPAVTGSGYVSATAGASTSFDLSTFVSKYGLWIAGGLGALWLFSGKRR